MALRDFITKVAMWFNLNKSQQQPKDLQKEQPADQGTESKDSSLPSITSLETRDESLQKLEKLEQGFTKMVSHLEGIDSHLKSFPDFVENQKQLTQQILEYVKATSGRNQKLIEAVERAPGEIAKANRRIIWTVVIFVGLGLVVILALIGLIIYLKQ